MSTNTEQTTLTGQQVEKIEPPKDISGLARVLWLVGRSDQFTDTAAELKETYRRADQCGVLEGEQ